MSVFIVHIITIDAQTEKYRSVVKSQVVDEYGKPVPNASVYFDLEEGDEFEGNKHATGTDSEGNFVIESTSNIASRIRRLFTTVFEGEKIGLYKVNTPNYLLVKSPTYSGIPIVLSGKDETIELGKIQLQIWFENIELFVCGEDCKPFYKSLRDWGTNFNIVIRDE